MNAFISIFDAAGKELPFDHVSLPDLVAATDCLNEFRSNIPSAWDIIIATDDSGCQKQWKREAVRFSNVYLLEEKFF